MTTTTSRIFISIKPEILCESRRPLRLRVDCFFCCTSISHNQLPETWSETLLKKHDVVALYRLNTDKMSFEFEDKTVAIIGSAFKVYDILGHGF